MGLDVELWAKDSDLSVTAEELEVYFDSIVPGFVFSMGTQGGWVWIRSLERYHSKGYPRGNPATLVAACELLQSVCGSEIKYQTDDYGEPVPWSTVEDVEHLRRVVNSNGA